jgi:hypothetical protein
MQGGRRSVLISTCLGTGTCLTGKVIFTHHALLFTSLADLDITTLMKAFPHTAMVWLEVFCSVVAEILLHF